MAKPEWGSKRTGPCGTKFYDFNKSPIICPGCGSEVIANELKTKINKKEQVENNLKSNPEKIESSEESSKDIVLDTGVLDNDIINEEASLDEVDSELGENISDDEDINLINDDNDIVLDVEIDEDDQ